MSEPIGKVATVAQQAFRRWQAAQQGRNSTLVVYVMETRIGRPFAVLFDAMAQHWLSISDSMRFGVHAALGPTNLSPPLFATQGPKP